MKKIKEIILPIYIVFNVLFMLILSNFRMLKTIDLKFIANSQIILLIINVLIIICMLIYKLIKKEKYKFEKYDLLLFLIIIFGVISSIFAIKQDVSIFGEKYRYEGFLAICYYITLVFINSNIEKKYKKIVIYSILFSGFIQAIYAFLQSFDNIPYVVRVYNYSWIWVEGFISNPNFFASFMIICLSYSLGLFVDEEKISLKIIDIILIIVFMTGLLISDTLSCLVGLFVVLIFLFVYIIKNKMYKKLAIILLVLSTTSIILCKFDKTSLFDDLVKTATEIKEASSGKSDGHFGTNRMYIWSNTIKIVPKYLIHGVGIDNFSYAFNGKSLKDKRYRYDKAHNEYLQILVCEGIFCLITYLLLYGIIIISGIKSSFKNKKVLFILPIIGYLTQAFFNISVIEVAPIFYIGLGLCIDRNRC